MGWSSTVVCGAKSFPAKNKVNRWRQASLAALDGQTMRGKRVALFLVKNGCTRGVELGEVHAGGFEGPAGRTIAARESDSRHLGVIDELEMPYSPAFRTTAYR